MKKISMKKLILTAGMIAMSMSICYGTEKEISSEIKNVTVYQQGAQVTRMGDVYLQKGKTVLLFKGLPSEIGPESIQAKASDDVMIISVTHSIDYLNKPIVSKEITLLNDRRRELIDSIKMVKNYMSVYAQEREMIIANKSIAGDNGVNINELEQAAAFFRKRLTGIESATHKLDNILFELKSELVKASKQLLELNAKIDLPASLVSVVVSSEKETKTTLQLDYFIGDAGWSPAYDVRITDVNEPLRLFYKAKVFQNTDEDWDNVNLTLSTGNPSISNNKPELAAYYLTFDNYYRPATGKRTGSEMAFNGHVSGTITDGESGEPLIGATIMAKGTTTGVIADMDGHFQLDLPQGSNTLVVSFIGYKSQEIIANSPAVNVVMTADYTALDEVVVVGYGSGDNESYDYKSPAPAKFKKIEQVPLAIEKRQLTTEFRIDIPYSIPSDNKPYDVTMVEYEIDAEYEYSAVPKVSHDAFLIANIPEYISYNLLGGDANIFFKGIYQGASFIDPQITGDTLTLSVGRDKDIIVEREIQKDFTSKGIAGTNRKEQKAFTITIKNNKSIPVDITIEDQYPISKVNEIKVDLIESSGARVDVNTGKLTWDLNLAPSEKKVINLRYSVRYPAGRDVIVD